MAISPPWLLALDWGTSSARAYLLDGAGQVLMRCSSDMGVMAVTAHVLGAGLTRQAAFQQAFDDLCGKWLREYPVPVIACGMVGSDQGWAEAAYLDLPVDIMSTAIPLTTVASSFGPVHIVPGLMRSNAVPGVMRGEETQILGVLLELSDETRGGGDPSDTIVVLPGTHTKWATLSGTVIKDFTTFMTGEVYGLLTSDSILARLAQPAEQPRWEAFEMGLDIALGEEGRAGVLNTMFSARTLVITGRIAPADVEDYLSGLLVGAEISGIAETWLGPAAPVVLCGEAQLCERYARALSRVDVPARTITAAATPRALFHLAQLSALIPNTPATRWTTASATLSAPQPAHPTTQGT